MVFHLAYKFCLNHHEAEDITQDVFLKLARAIRGFEGKSKFSTWMYRIVSSVYLDCQKKKKQVEELDDNIIHEISQGDDHSESVVHALSKLPLKQRQAVVLVYYEGLDHAETAEVLSCPETTVSWRIYRAKQKLKVLLKDL